MAFSKDNSLPTRSGTRIEDALHLLPERSRCKFGHKLRAFVLYRDSALQKGSSGGYFARNSGAGAREELTALKKDPGLVEFGFCIGVCKAHGDCGLDLAVAADCASCFEAIEIRPALHHPGRVGFGEGEFGRILLRIVDARRAGQFAEHSVNDAGCEAMTGLLGQFHALVYCCTCGNAIEIQYLERAHAQRDKNFRIDLGVGMREERPQLVVDPDLPPKHTQHQRRGQIAVNRGESVDRFATKQVVRMRLAAFDCQQNVEGCLARR